MSDLFDINLRIRQDASGLFFADSTTLPGLLVVHADLADLLARLPSAIAQLQEVANNGAARERKDGDSN